MAGLNVRYWNLDKIQEWSCGRQISLNLPNAIFIKHLLQDIKSLTNVNDEHWKSDCSVDTNLTLSTKVYLLVLIWSKWSSVHATSHQPVYIVNPHPPSTIVASASGTTRLTTCANRGSYLMHSGYQVAWCRGEPLPLWNSPLWSGSQQPDAQAEGNKALALCCWGSRIL